ncbi:MULTISPECIES: hypothetical protein [Haloferax]|uniref:Uncharacterized protein n=2 Tax=Haloferax TaxID=2251 RepID=A0A6G1YZF4_9EURY|nr:MULTISPECIES: hypothetical protein [Haloferax]KAB1186993.1 hypothetical protein Hfx1149_02685 [Haloferax sp. CBA1149]MRW79625.1 hypothetical protein [Haloferax marinisediminis]
MNRQNWRGFVFLLVGIALLANPLYLYPDNVSYETAVTFEGEQIDEIPRHGQLEMDLRYGNLQTDIHWCPGNGRECAIAEALADGQTLRYDIPSHREPGDYDEPFPADYDYIHLSEGEGDYYRPAQTVENGSVVLSLEQVDEGTVMQAAAEEYHSDRPLHAAVENGTTTVVEDEVYWDGAILVEQNGNYYVVRAVESDRYPTGWGWKAPSPIVIDAMRLAAWIGGVALIWRAGEWTERGR